MLTLGPVNRTSISQLPHFLYNVSSLVEAMLCGNNDSKSMKDSVDRNGVRKETPADADKSLTPSILEEVQCI